MINFFIGLLLSFLFLSLPVLLVVVGVKSIIEKESIMPGPVFMQGRVKGVKAVIAGVIYLLMAFGVFSMYASFYNTMFCETNSWFCKIATLLEVPFNLIGKLLNSS